MGGDNSRHRLLLIETFVFTDGASPVELTWQTPARHGGRATGGGNE